MVLGLDPVDGSVWSIILNLSNIPRVSIHSTKNLSLLQRRCRRDERTDSFSICESEYVQWMTRYSARCRLFPRPGEAVFHREKPVPNRPPRFLFDHRSTVITIEVVHCYRAWLGLLFFLFVRRLLFGCDREQAVTSEKRYRQTVRADVLRGPLTYSGPQRDRRSAYTTWSIQIPLGRRTISTVARAQTTASDSSAVVEWLANIFRFEGGRIQKTTR